MTQTQISVRLLARGSVPTAGIDAWPGDVAELPRWLPSSGRIATDACYGHGGAENTRFVSDAAGMMPWSHSSRPSAYEICTDVPVTQARLDERSGRKVAARKSDVHFRPERDPCGPTPGTCRLRVMQWAWGKRFRGVRLRLSPTRPFVLMTTPPWTCWRDGQTYGPYDDASLRSLAQTGRIRPSDLISNGGAWVAAASVPGLFPPGAGAPQQQYVAPQQDHSPQQHGAPPMVAVMPLAPPHPSEMPQGAPPAMGAPPRPMQGAPGMAPVPAQMAPQMMSQPLPGAYPPPFSGPPTHRAAVRADARDSGRARRCSHDGRAGDARRWAQTGYAEDDAAPVPARPSAHGASGGG